MYDVEVIQEKIDQIRFKSIESIRMSEALYHEIKYVLGANFIREIRNMLGYMLTVEVEQETKGEVRKYLLFSEKDNTRKDHNVWFKKVYDVLDDAELFVMWNRSDGKKHWENLKYLHLLPVWLWQMRKMKEISMRSRFHYACWMMARYPFYRMLKEHIDGMDNLQCFVTCCDIHFCSSLATQFLNNRDCKTVTIAHGNFMDENTPVYYKSSSQYMILYSKLMMKNAIKYGNEKRCVVLGDPRCINREFIAANTKGTRNKVLGVLLRYGIDSEENILILESAKWCAERMGYKLKVKKIRQSVKKCFL